MLNRDVLTSLRSQHIVAVRLHPYVEIGFESVELHCASGRIVAIESGELSDTCFDAYSIAVREIERDGAAESFLAAHQDIRVQMRVEDIEIFRSDEWQDQEVPQYPTVGQNPVSVSTGPLGSAPPDAAFITVVCGVSVRCSDEPASSLLMFLNDFPGLVGLARTQDEVDSYRSITSSESLW